MPAPKQRRALTTQAVKVGTAKTGKLGKAGGAVAGRTQTGSRVGSTDAAIKSSSKAHGRSSPTTGIGGSKAIGGGGGGSLIPSDVVATTTYAGGVKSAPTPLPTIAPSPAPSLSRTTSGGTLAGSTTVREAASATATRTVKPTTAATTTTRPTATATKVGTHSLSEVRRYVGPEGTIGPTVVKTAGGGSAKRAGGPMGKKVVAKKAVTAKRVAKVARKTPPKGVRTGTKKPVAKKLTKQQMARRFG